MAKKQDKISNKAKQHKASGRKSNNEKLCSKYKIHLRNGEDIRRLLSSTINEVRRDEIPESRAKTIGYLCNVLLTTLELTSLEERLAALETKAMEAYQ